MSTSELTREDFIGMAYQEISETLDWLQQQIGEDVAAGMLEAIADGRAQA
jgi:hypothetical protein